MTSDELAAVIEGIAPVIRDYVTRAQHDLVQRVTVAETQLTAVVASTKEIGPLRERVAVALTTRIPGPPGQDGAPGQPGKDGKDGADGTPGLVARGVFVDGQAYERGQLVTWAGSSWHCNETTQTKPGEGSKAWTLMVKRGRDGKDGKDGGPGPSGPPGADWQAVYDKTRRR
jgi:hypothetical protein